MKLRAQQVILPCISFGVRARLATGSGKLTPIELVALRAIALGLDDIESLSQVLGLGQRPTLDLIYDFWLKGYVVVDTSQARVRLAGVAEQAHRGPGLETLATAENNFEVIPLVQELVSGAVLPLVGQPHPVGRDSELIPTHRRRLSLEGVTQGELLDAVQREVERQSRKLGRPLAVQEVWIEPDQLLTEATAESTFVQQRRFLPVLADIERDVDSERLAFYIVEAPEIPPPIRKDIERHLSLLSERLPEQLFFKRLGQVFDRASSDVPVTAQDAALERLVRATKELSDIDPGLVESRHEELLELHRDAGFEIRAIASADASVRPVVGYTDHEVELRRMIVAAERQLVLGNPWVRIEALLEPLFGTDDSWFDLLNAALSRGVQVFLLWGIRADSRLDSRVKNALFDLSARHSNRFAVSIRSSTLHAKFVVRDAHQALVTSYNFLDPPARRDSLEMGLLIEGKAAGVAPSALLDLLVWARDAFPEYVTSQRMLLLPHELGAAETNIPDIPSPPAEPDAVAAQREGADPGPAIRYWGQAWRMVAESLDMLARESEGGAELLIDGEHRETLWRALRQSTNRLVVLSDKISVDVVTDRFVRLLRSRLEAGVRCSLVYRHEGATDVDEGPAQRLRLQAEKFPDLCSLVATRSHAKVLVSDDEVTVGSFNFLSYGGEYTSSTIGRERAELSLRVRSSAAVDRVLTALEGQWPAAFEGLRRRSPATLQIGAAARVPRSLQPLFHALARAQEPGDALLSWFEDSETPWEDLELLKRAEVPAELLATAAAAVLAVAPDIDNDDACQWRRLLAETRWTKADFIGCALLLSRKPEGTSGLEPWLALLGASVQSRVAPFAEPLPPTDALSKEQVQATALLLMVSVLENGWFDYLDTLDELTAVLPATFRSWIVATKAYCEAAYQPLPMELLRRNASRQRRAQEAKDARDEFESALASAENVGFRFPLGEHTWERLKSDGYLLGEMRNALNGNNPGALSKYLNSLNTREFNPERLMDEASYEVRDEHNTQIEGTKRTVCLKRLQRAFDKGRRWVDSALDSTDSPSDAHVLGLCWRLKDALTGLSASAGLDIKSLAVPVQQFALDRLKPLFDAEDA